MMAPGGLSRRRKQAGFTLIELGVVLGLAMLGLAYAGREVIIKASDARAEATGKYLLTVKGAMDDVIASNYNAYARSLPIANVDGSQKFADPLAPTAAELKTLGHLNASFPERTPAGQEWKIAVSRTAATCPGVGCRIEAVVYTTTPFRSILSADPDYGAAAAATRAMGAFGGAAWRENEAKIRGPQFEIDNPVLPSGGGAGQGGIVAAVAMLDTTMWNQFVRMGDDRDPALQGNLSAQGAATFDKIGLRNTVVPGAACTPTDFANPANPATAALNLAGNVEFAKTAAGGLAACLAGRWSAIASIADVNAVCGTGYPEGALANTPTGEGLVCRDGYWAPVSQFLSRFVQMATYRVLAGTTTIPHPACGQSGGVAGTPRMYVNPQSIQPRGSFNLQMVKSGDFIVDSGSTMTLNALNFSATSTGSSWNVTVPPGSEALAIATCYYG